MKHTLVLIILFTFFLIDCVAQTGNLDVILTGKILKLNKEQLSLEFSLENKSNESIYVATNPSQLFGEVGYYFLLDETDNSVLQVSSRVYPPPPYLTYVDKRRVELKKLKSGDEYSESIFIKLPTKETRPPKYRHFKENLVLGNIKQIKLTIGYFVEEEGIIEFLQSKPFGWWIKGEELLSTGKYKDKTFLEIQDLVTVNITP